MNKKLILLITICINLIVFAFLFVTHKSSNKLNIVLTNETIATKEDEPVFFDIAKKEEFGNIRKGEFYENVKQKDLQNRNIRYKITTFSADCSEIKLQKLTYPIIQYFNDKNELVETNNPYEYWQRNYPDGHLGVTHASDIENGELYFNILCNNEQFKFNASQELQNAYSKAIKFCLKDKISEQNGTGGFYICKGNYIRNNSPSIETEWDSIFKTCFYNNPISNIDKCLDKIVVK